jgi:hypothetical protein
VTATVSPGVSIESITFEASEILRELKALDPKGSAGPDGYTPVLFFFKLSESLVLPLSLLYSSFMSVGQVPTDWKRAIVVPIHKSGTASSPANYRPISLTSVFCKLMERVISRQITNYLPQHGLISQHQHGFLSISDRQQLIY